MTVALRYLTPLLVAWVLLLSGCGSAEQGDVSVDARGKPLFYKSPMDPSFISTNPGKDSMGMDLVPVYEGDPAADLDRIEINGATMQRMGVRLDPIRKGKLTRVVRALGRVDFDEKRIANVNMKFDGWIEHLYVNETGQKVEKGDPLFAVYSPELLAGQKEYLTLLDSAAPGPHGSHLISAARDRLLQYDVPASFLRQIEKTGQPRRTVTIHAPVGGYVVHKVALEGSYVKQGASLFTIADLDALWVQADVFEFDAPWVVAGQKATIELDYLPGHIQEATVDYVYPTINERSRTVQVRLVLPNPEVALKPGMFATVRIHTEPVGDTLLVPTEAVIHSGESQVVFVSRGDGLFDPRQLELGVRGDDYYQVLSGLEEGDMVVTSGQFLIDSESRLKEAIKKMLGSNIPVSGAGGDDPMGGAMPPPEAPANERVEPSDPAEPGGE